MPAYYKLAFRKGCFVPRNDTSGVVLSGFKIESGHRRVLCMAKMVCGGYY